MPPKKKGVFRAIKVKAKSGRGGGDIAAFWEYMMDKSNGVYDNLVEQYKAASEEEQTAAKEMLNEVQPDFGDLFYESTAMADMGWSEGTPEDKKNIRDFFDEHILPEDWKQEEEA